jgi:hypothetical protein
MFALINGLLLLVKNHNIEQRQIQQFEMYQQALYEQRDFILMKLQTVNNNVWSRYGGTLQNALHISKEHKWWVLLRQQPIDLICFDQHIK